MSAIAIAAPAYRLASAATMQAWCAVRAAHERPGACGDRVFVLPIGSDRTALVSIDVAGHGAERAPLSAALAAEISASLLRDASPAIALARADSRLRTFVTDRLPYAVAAVAVVHPIVRTVVFASAGCDAAFTLARDGRVVPLVPTGPMLGIPLAPYFGETAFGLDSVGTLVFATDGVSDSRPAGSQNFFGTRGTALAVARSLRAGGDPAQAALASACAHAGGRQADDMGVVVARIRSPGGAS